MLRCTSGRESPAVLSGAQPRLKSSGGPRFGSQHRAAPHPALGVGCGRGSPPPAVRVRGYHPRKISEHSDAKSCILVTTCCEISCFLKTTAKKLGTNTLLVPQPKSWGTSLPQSLRLWRLWVLSRHHRMPLTRMFQT